MFEGLNLCTDVHVFTLFGHVMHVDNNKMGSD